MQSPQVRQNRKVHHRGPRAVSPVRRPRRTRAGRRLFRRAQRPPRADRDPLHRPGPRPRWHPFHAYRSDADALRDVLNLARGMSYKAAMAGLDLGGGKAVILGDPLTDKTPELLRAYGRFVQSLERPLLHRLRRRHLLRGHGRHRRGEPLRDRAHGRARAARATARCSRRTASSRGCAPPRRRPGALRRSPAARVGVAGVGKVGRHLVEHLLEDGADVVVSDVYEPAVAPAHRGSPRGRGRARHRRAGRRAAGRLLPVRARRRPHRRGRRDPPGDAWSAGPPTTSSPTPAWRSSWPTAGSSTRPTTS